jgi:gas vesicle protein
MTARNKIILGVIGAAAAGAIIGLLIAPEKGDDLRKNIRNTAGDWADKLSDLLASGKKELANLKSSARSEANHVKSRAEDVIGNF